MVFYISTFSYFLSSGLSPISLLLETKEFILISGPIHKEMPRKINVE